MEIDACPFCFSLDSCIVNTQAQSTVPSWYFVMCNSCGAEGPPDLGESGAIEKWNQAAVNKLLEASLAFLEWAAEEAMPPFSSLFERVVEKCAEVVNEFEKQTKLSGSIRES